MTDDDTATLYTLGDRGQTIGVPTQDVRGREVRDAHGVGIGNIADLLIDDREHKVRFLLVEHGGLLGLGEKKTLIPVEAIAEITGQSVAINQSWERVAAAPGYDPDLVDERQYHATIYGHYGYGPYWRPGSMRPRDGMYHL